MYSIIFAGFVKLMLLKLVHCLKTKQWLHICRRNANRQSFELIVLNFREVVRDVIDDGVFGRR